MEPALKAGSFVLVRQRPKNINVDDIVAFKHEGQTFIKRTVEIKNDQLWLVGDNPNDSLDSKRIGWINRENITGKIIWK